MKLEGGFTRCALTFLTSGITTSDFIDDPFAKKQVYRLRSLGGQIILFILEILKTGIYEYLHQNEDNLLVTASNYGNDSLGNGLIPGHAYCIQGRSQNLNFKT